MGLIIVLVSFIVNSLFLAFIIAIIDTAFHIQLSNAQLCTASATIILVSVSFVTSRLSLKIYNLFNTSHLPSEQEQGIIVPVIQDIIAQFNHNFKTDYAIKDFHFRIDIHNKPDLVSHFHNTITLTDIAAKHIHSEKIVRLIFSEIGKIHDRSGLVLRIIKTVNSPLLTFNKLIYALQMNKRPYFRPSVKNILIIVITIALSPIIIFVVGWCKLLDYIVAYLNSLQIKKFNF